MIRTKNILYLILISFFSLTSQLLKGQGNGFINIEAFETDIGETKIIILPSATSFSVKFWNGSFEKSYIKAGRDIFYLNNNPEINNPNFNISHLYFFSKPVDTLIFYSGMIRGKVEIHTYAPAPLGNIVLKRIAAGSCGEPESISPDVWRAGLPSPKVTPDSTKVAHVIVHHSATNLTNTDALTAVRSIYLYHTESNGWDDIGYNFLIAPDGTIFQGRDDMGLYNADNVRGSHFCGKNSNTMGICVLGNFMNAEPSQEALASLEQLITWKITKERINGTASAIHPTGTTTLLSNIAGHRDGCATECPGDLLYNKLSQIRISTHQNAETCNSEKEVTFYPNPANDFIYLKNNKSIVSYSIIDVSGKVIIQDKKASYDISVNFLPSGLYLLKVNTGINEVKHKFLKD